MSDNYPPYDTSTPNDPYADSRALPAPMTPAGYTGDQPTTPLSGAGQAPPLPAYGAAPYTPPTGAYGAPPLAGGGSGGSQRPTGPYAAPTPSRRPGWRRWALIGGVIAVGLIILGGAAWLAAVASAHGTTTASATTTAATTTPVTGNTQYPIYTVGSVSATTINATDAKGATVVITITTKTAFVRAGQSASLSDITTGTRIQVRGHYTSDTAVTARRISILLPVVNGKVTAINGNSITLKTRKGTVTVTVSATTTFGKGQTFSDIHVGDIVVAEGTPNSDGSFTAFAMLDRTVVLNAAGASATVTPAA